MDPKDSIERLEKAKDFATWREDHKKSYLSHFFCIQDPYSKSEDDNVWQVDFYNPNNDTLTSFSLPMDKRKKCELKMAESKVFKPEGEVIEELTLKKINQTDNQVLEAAKEGLKKYKEQSTKAIMILQHSRELNKIVWNVTLMTDLLNLFNVKIDADSGEVLEESHQAASSLQKEVEK